MFSCEFRLIINPYTPLPRWVSDNTNLPSNNKIFITLVCRLIHSALVVLKLLMIKLCEIIGISKIEFFNFTSNERVKKNQNNLKTIQNILSFQLNHFSSNFNKIQIVFCFPLKPQPIRSVCPAGRVIIQTYLRIVIS